MAARTRIGGRRASDSRPVSRLAAGTDSARRSPRSRALRIPLTPAGRAPSARSRCRDLLELGQVVQVVAGQHLHDDADRLRATLAVDVGALEVPRAERADEGEVPGPQPHEGAG